jgi:L-alanine-DL-glutamate epimerase-like enolase superfamily enzyme
VSDPVSDPVSNPPTEVAAGTGRDGRLSVPVEGLTASAYTVPTDGPEADGTLTWDRTTLVLVRVRAGGTEGLGYTYAPAAACALIDDVLAAEVVGLDAGDVGLAARRMAHAVRNLGRDGVAALAVSAVDCALWDLKARLLGVPLDRLLGRVRDRVPVYGSGGFTTYDAQRLAAQVTGWLESGCRAVKIKIAEAHGRRSDRDVRRVAVGRRLVGDEAGVFVDGNGGYSAKQAIRVFDRIRSQGVTWFEEPVSSDDLPGLRLVRESVTADVAAGEYGFDLQYFARMCAAGAVDCLQVDVTRCGGITGWLAAVAVAAAHGLEVSAHCAPALTLAPAAATTSLRHVEWFHDHVRLEELLFPGRPTLREGAVSLPDAAGNGLAFDSTRAERYRVA